jgi:aspartyl-tRNA(Asn)/glutamyl-tRNA(Gln) amidotransferase subunit C
MTVEEVRQLATLARLRFTDEELAKFTAEFSAIVDYIGHITAADLTGVEPLTSVSGAENRTRADVEGDGLTAEEALRNAPSKNEAFFKVPRVLG